MSSILHWVGFKHQQDAMECTLWRRSWRIEKRIEREICIPTCCRASSKQYTPTPRISQQLGRPLKKAVYKSPKWTVRVQDKVKWCYSVVTRLMLQCRNEIGLQDCSHARYTPHDFLSNVLIGQWQDLLHRHVVCLVNKDAVPRIDSFSCNAAFSVY